MSELSSIERIKTTISIEQVLQHYALADNYRRSGNGLVGPCPIHKGGSPTQFRVNVSKNTWTCLGECKHGGNVLDLIAILENISTHAAAMKAIDWFRIADL